MLLDTRPAASRIEKFGVSMAGAQNEINTTFTTPDVFVTGTLRVFVNGFRLLEGAANGYTVAGPSSVSLAFALITQDCIWADYKVGP